MTVLEDLLRHIVGLSQLNCMIYVASLESYEETSSTINLGRLAQMHAVLKHMLQELGRPGMVWLCAYPYPHCGCRTFHDPTSIL
ncbi:Melanoma antigen preferentially expressed in tumors [Myotis davidii]|uniref:Melanoma antigen preferentially expressed in tumors n=1 Tax=Myotis davidii TaxID=225400 RepID=L5LB81_MYODS|nr:Melanoma antigen preferentially expressed in tumors [Myotis davidii]